MTSNVRISTMKRKAWGDWDPICTFNEPNNFPPTTPPPTALNRFL